MSHCRRARLSYLVGRNADLSANRLELGDCESFARRQQALARLVLRLARLSEDCCDFLFVESALAHIRKIGERREEIDRNAFQ